MIDGINNKPVPKANLVASTSTKSLHSHDAQPMPASCDSGDLRESVGLMPSAGVSLNLGQTIKDSPVSERDAGGPLSSASRTGQLAAQPSYAANAASVVSKKERTNQSRSSRSAVSSDILIIGDGNAIQNISHVEISDSAVLQQIVYPNREDPISGDDQLVRGKDVQPTVASRQLMVFICYALDDKPKIRDLCRKLRMAGFWPWLDEDELLPGQDWKTEIRRAIKSSDAVLICLSQKMIEKAGYVQSELRLVMEVATLQPVGKIFLIPARLEPCEVPDHLSDRQWVDLCDPKGLDRLLAALRARAIDVGVALT